MGRLRLGTRGSALALAQARWVSSRLKRLHKGLEIEQIVILTSGDRFSRRSVPTQTPQGNTKAMFVQEIEEALMRREIDFAVHSAKDVPAQLPEGLKIAAYPPREDPRDVFVGAMPWNQIPSGAALGTSSLRRQIQLRILRPDLEFISVRGNVDTRLRKLKGGGMTGLVLALAGLKRLSKDRLPMDPLPVELLVPAPGQGALALEILEARQDVSAILAPLTDHKTQVEVELERAFLRAVGGGCSTPLGALARLEGPQVFLTIFWSKHDGSQAMRLSGSCGTGSQELASLVENLSRQLII